MTSPFFEGVKSLELTTRRVLSHSHKIPCSTRDSLAYVRKIDKSFVAINFKGKESIVRPHVLRQRYQHVALTKLAGFNERLFHVRGDTPPPSTLLSL